MIKVRIRLNNTEISTTQEIVADLSTKPGVVCATYEGDNIFRLDIDEAKSGQFASWIENLIPTRKQ